jgi:predicted nucleic acid-binding protein
MSNVIIVDTSLVLKWVVNETDSLLAYSLLQTWTDNGMKLLAPDLLIYEFTNALFQNFRRGKLTFIQVQAALTAFLAFDISIARSEISDLRLRALEYAQSYTLPAAYDAFYLALAEYRGCEL